MTENPEIDECVRKLAALPGGKFGAPLEVKDYFFPGYTDADEVVKDLGRWENRVDHQALSPQSRRKLNENKQRLGEQSTRWYGFQEYTQANQIISYRDRAYRLEESIFLQTREELNKLENKEELQRYTLLALENYQRLEQRYQQPQARLTPFQNAT